MGRAALVVGISRATAFRRLPGARSELVERTLSLLGAQLRLSGEELQSLWRAVGSKLQRGVGVFGHVVATGQPLLINGTAADLLPAPQDAQARDPHSPEPWCRGPS